MIGHEDTIAAVATGLTEAGIGIVRISGPLAVMVGAKVFRPRRGSGLAARRTHTVTYGWVVDQTGEMVDEALALVMRGPHSFTGEDVVEIHSHGGQVALRRVLEVVQQAGARLAEPGEFSRRAFLNGRMDLAQAESVIDVIRAKTDRAMAAAVQQLRGELSSGVTAIRDRLLETIAHLEADIDFPELELEVQTQGEVETGCRWSLEQVTGLLQGAGRGRILREGLRVVLVGRPNVGKSRLLNRLVRENRAIVTAIPGTTRDVIEEWLNLRGVPVLLADTAGIRETEDLVERLGVERSVQALRRADLALLVIDAATGLCAEDRELLGQIPAEVPKLAVVNKIDLVEGVAEEAMVRALGGIDLVAVSAETGAGVEVLEERIAAHGGALDLTEGLAVNARQSEALRRAESHLRSALGALEAGIGSDLVSIDVRAAWAALGEITGETVAEDLLDQIFSRFCIGK